MERVGPSDEWEPASPRYVVHAGHPGSEQNLLAPFPKAHRPALAARRRRGGAGLEDVSGGEEREASRLELLRRFLR